VDLARQMRFPRIERLAIRKSVEDVDEVTANETAEIHVARPPRKTTWPHYTFSAPARES
jgi:hypothetical protein